MTLEEIGFSFDHLRKNNAQSLFGSHYFSSSNYHVFATSCHGLVRLSNASCWLTTHGDKKVKWPSIFKLIQHTNNWEVGMLFFQCTIFPTIGVLPPGYGWIYSIFLMTNDIIALLEISLDVHVFTLSQCWQVL